MLTPLVAFLMPATPSASSCPFCQAAVPPKAVVCPACHARKQPPAGMSPAGFRAFALIWLGCTVVLAAAAAYLALVPWLPQREAPTYALRLVGAAPAAPRCTVEVIAGTDGVASRPAPVPCGGAEAMPVAEPADPVRRRFAAVLHGVLVLSLAAALSLMLRLGLRPLFLRRGTPSWVRSAVR